MDYKDMNAIGIVRLMLTDGVISQEVAGKYFPELKESDDEGIRKALMQNLKERFGTKGNMGKGLNMPDVLAWFEKQCEQKPADKVEPKFKVGDIITNGELIGKVDEIVNNKYHGRFGYNKDLSNHYADIPDIEDWHLWTIQDAKAGDVLTTDLVHFILKSKDDMSCYMYCNYSVVSNSFDTSYTAIVDSKYVHPATKEQRDLLFQKMHEAGYEWDAEKKELKKIEQKSWSEEDEDMRYKATAVINRLCAEGKEYVWSISTLKKLFYWLKSLKDRVGCEVNSITAKEWSEKDEQYLLVCKNALSKYQVSDKWDANIISRWLEDKLKSLRPQNKCTYNPYKEIVESISEMCKHYVKASPRGLQDFYDNVRIKCKDAKEYDSLFPQSTWKPSDKQMDALKSSTYCQNKQMSKVLFELYQDLKKLREE